MPVVVVESPAKAKTINKYLGSDYTVLDSYGHVRDLPPFSDQPSSAARNSRNPLVRVPRDTSCTGPVSVISIAAVTVTSMLPPSIRTSNLPGVALPDFTAAAATAQADVPEAEVGPTPLSQIRASRVRPSRTRATWTLVPSAKAG